MGACENCGRERDETTELCACGEAAPAEPMSAAVNALFDHPALRETTPDVWPLANAEQAFELTAPMDETSPEAPAADGPIPVADTTSIDPSLPYDEPSSETESWPVGALEFEHALLREMRPDFERAEETPVGRWQEHETLEHAHEPESPYVECSAAGDMAHTDALASDALVSDVLLDVTAAPDAFASDVLVNDVDLDAAAIRAIDESTSLDDRDGPHGPHGWTTTAPFADPVEPIADKADAFDRASILNPLPVVADAQPLHVWTDAPPSAATTDDEISDTFDDLSQTDTLVPGIQVPPPTVAAAPHQRGLAFGARELGIVGVAVVIGAVATFSLLKPSPSSAAPATPRGATPPTRAAASSPKPAPVTPRHTWSSANRDWVGAQRHAVAFEVIAENKVQTWGQTAQPVLVVRCADHRIESFVFIASAAKLEAKDDRHSVHYQFDESPAVDDRWADSDEHDALFAPDGAAFTKQVQQASTLHFGYTPHNAAPVTANFNVAGLSEAMLTAKPCGASK